MSKTESAPQLPAHVALDNSLPSNNLSTPNEPSTVQVPPTTDPNKSPTDRKL
jgi:hypothetical protein